MNENLLRADQIGLGVVSVNADMVVLYTKVDPRLVMKKLDEKFGPLGWKKETQITYSPTMPGGNFVKMGHCTLSVFEKQVNGFREMIMVLRLHGLGKLKTKSLLRIV